MDKHELLKRGKNRELRDIVKSNIINMAETIKKEGKGKIASDVIGSYTGSGSNNGRPEQDADDL